METSKMDHDEILKDCNIHLAYLGNGLFSEIKHKQCIVQESGIHKLSNTTMRVKRTSHVETTSKDISKCVQTQNLPTGTINIKSERTGTTCTTGITSSVYGSGDISSTCGTVDILAGTSGKVLNTDSDTELIGTTTSNTFNITDDFTRDTTERVIGSINADARTLQLLVTENTRPKDTDIDASRIKIGHDTYSLPTIDRNPYHIHATYGNIALKDVQINLRRITDSDIDLWKAPRPAMYLDCENQKRPEHMPMLKDNIATNDDNTFTPLRSDKQALKRSKKMATARIEKRPKTRSSTKSASVSRSGSESTPVLSSRTTRTQKIRSGAKCPAFKTTVTGLERFRHKYHYKCIVNPCACRFSTV